MPRGVFGCSKLTQNLDKFGKNELLNIFINKYIQIY
jgi:hypothetical protein